MLNSSFPLSQVKLYSHHSPCLRSSLIMDIGWFSCLRKVVWGCRKAVSLWVIPQMSGFETESPSSLLKRAVFAALTCVFALGGAVVGTITGAIKGQTTETGFCRGAAIGAVTGAITAVHLLESTVNGESLSKVALLCSLVNGKVFMEWVSPAVLKAYQWQISTLQTSYGENSDIYDVAGAKGLSKHVIKQLPRCSFNSNKLNESDQASCTICLQDFKEGECTKRLPSCSHYFHLGCIDEWLARNGSCPICRKDV